MSKNKYDSIFVIGPTASGKTSLAVQLAHRLNGEIISADSRQVYKRMDIGTGKDLKEYSIGNQGINYHLIDICEPGEKYNIERFYTDCVQALLEINKTKKLPIICGGSGLYIETLLKGNEFSSIPKNEVLREFWTDLDKAELDILFQEIQDLLRLKLDNSSRKKSIRALEIHHFMQENGLPDARNLNLNPLIIAPKWDRINRRERISLRLKQRLNDGMIEEVQQLLAEGISPEILSYYGLEYLWISRYCLGEITLEEMTTQLEIGIHQFAKRQMTWFRRMEKQGFEIHWLNPKTAVEDALELFAQ